jgi:hypothetical protein
MTASEKRAFVRGYALARAHMSRQLRATKVKFDNDVDELRADIADIKAILLFILLLLFLRREVERELYLVVVRGLSPMYLGVALAT